VREKEGGSAEEEEEEEEEKKKKKKSILFSPPSDIQRSLGGLLGHPESSEDISQRYLFI